MANGPIPVVGAAGVYKGLESAALWGGLALAGTLAAVRFSPWFAHNFNYTARALIPCAGEPLCFLLVFASPKMKLAEASKPCLCFKSCSNCKGTSWLPLVVRLTT